MVTRVLGLIRERVFAHYFGIGLEADAYRAALKIPNIIRNLLGEGTLSASFIPVYAAVLERGDEDGARRLAGAVLSFLILVAFGGALIGVLFAPLATRAVAFGFSDEARALTTQLVRILFPMAGVLIVSAWCLGVLNTHRRFFLAYAAPTFWNIAQIGTLIALGGVLAGADLVAALAWGALGGTLVQLGVQLPATLRCARGIAWSTGRGVDGFGQVVRAWIPVIAGAGALQVSSLVDTQLASLLGEGAVANLGYAQLIGILPVSLFGISVAAASLPELSRDAVTTNTAAVRTRLANGIRHVLYFVVPSAVAFVTIGREIVGLILQTGAFDQNNTFAVSTVLLGIGLGLPAAGLVKLLASGHYAFGDTKTPVRIAVLSVSVSGVLGFLLMRRFGVLGIALGGAAGAYVNVVANYVTLRRKTDGLMSAEGMRAILVSLIVAVLSGVVARSASMYLPPMPVAAVALTTIALFGLVYLSGTAVARHPDVPFPRTGR